MMDLRHGYTLADIDYLVRGVLYLDRWHRGMDIDEKASVARLAILEALHAAPHWPQRHDLLRAGSAAVSDYVRKERAYAGQEYGNAWSENGSRPRWVMYWEWATRNTPSHEYGIVERRALHQIWSRLSDTHRAVLAALAAHEDYRAAAAAVGKTYGTFTVTLNKARQEVRRLWHEHETPRGMWGTDRRADKGETRSRKATAPVTRRIGRRAAPEPVHNASRYTNHGCRCVECTADASRVTRERRRAAGASARQRLTEEQLSAMRRRREAGATLAEIASEFGFAGSYVSRLLSGARKPRMEAA